MLASAWVYILTNNPRHTTLYAGSTIDLPTRLWEHLTRQNPKSFTARYNVTKLVYYEPFEHIDDAVKREWFIKGKNRKWKEDLINKSNPEWRDLSEEIMRCRLYFLKGLSRAGGRRPGAGMRVSEGSSQRKGRVSFCSMFTIAICCACYRSATLLLRIARSFAYAHSCTRALRSGQAVSKGEASPSLKDHSALAGI